MKIDLYQECVPEDWRDHFEVKEIEKKNGEYIFRVEEKEEHYPKELLNQSMAKKSPIILNGFLDRIEVVHFPFNDLPVYLHVYRRRWKLKGGRASHHNKHDLHPKGMKCTREFGNFLKELSGQKRRQFFAAFPNIRHVREEDFSMVSRCTQWLHEFRESKTAS